MRSRSQKLGETLEHLSSQVTWWAGTSWAFALSAAAIVVWLLSGPLFGFSNTWQLVVNTGTTVITFLMVFLIQRSQNKDSQSVHIKLNEIVAVLEGASNRLILAEDLSEKELKVLHVHFRRLAHMAMHERSVGESHSIAEAEARHRAKSVEKAARR